LELGIILEQLLSPVPGGTGRYSAELAKAVAGAAAAGDGVAGWTAWHRDVRNANVERVAGPHRLGLPRRALAAAWERGLGPVPRRADVIHAPTLLVPPKRSAGLVVTIHDTVPWSHPETLTRRGVQFHRRMARRASQEADLILAPTEAAASDLDRVLAVGDRLRVVHPGIATTLTLPHDAAQRARALDLPESGFLLTVSTLEPRKGLDTLLRALALTPSIDLPLLVVGGSGWGGLRLEAEAAKLGLPPDRVRLLGHVADEDLATLYSRAHLFIQPSRQEGFGLPVLEAMALGAPVVTSDVPALLEVGAGAAHTFPVGDPHSLSDVLRDLTNNAGMRETMGRRGRARAAQFTWAQAAEHLWSLYRELT
jgi:glycosyltransferase involved in cell wall biosynthesis